MKILLNRKTKENMKQDESDLPIKKKMWKVYAVFAFICLGFFAVFARLFQIQIIDYEEYKKKAIQQHESRVVLRAVRGNIYDRNGRIIASTISRFSFALDPKVLTDNKVRESIAKSLSKITKEDKDEIFKRIKTHKSSFMWLVRNISGTDALAMLKYEDHNGFIVKKEPARNYSFGDAASQTIGFTDIDNKGLIGIELAFDSILRGKDGYAIMNRDALGHLRPMADLPRKEPKHGHSIQLTIDILLQRIVEYELKQGVANAQAQSGAVVAIDPATGEVMAMASYPNFNPNQLRINDPNTMKNRAIGDLYEPGSTFKVITAAAAINEGLIEEDDMVDGLNGTQQYKDHTIIDDHPLGRVTFREAFAKSSNIVLSNLALRLPGNSFYKYIRDFGIGINTAIELPGEVSGRLRKVEQFNASAQMFAGFGYGIALTPLQLAMVYATVANKGALYKPYVVKNIFNSEGERMRQVVPTKVRNVITAETAEKLSRLLVNVVDNGTGINAKINGIKVAGKTGTAQQLVDGSYKNKQYTASFAGFFPADNPKLAMVVILDKPQNNYYGGSVAAPIFRNIAQRWISLQPDVIRLPKGKSFVHTDSVVVPNFRGMFLSDAYSLMRIYGFTPATKDSTSRKVIVRQDPAPRTKVYKGTTIYFGFDNMDDVSSLTAEVLRPNLVGMSARRAVNILHSKGIRVVLKGSGKVSQQLWSGSGKNVVCTLHCK